MSIDALEMNRRLIKLAESWAAGFWAQKYDALPEPKTGLPGYLGAANPGEQWWILPVLFEYEFLDGSERL